MAFSMKVSNDKLEGMDVVPPGEYELKLLAFNPKISKKGDTVNLNPCFEIVNNPEYINRKVFDTMNTAGMWTWADIVHALGLPMETDGKDSWIPGDFKGNPAAYKEDDPSTWKYQGPLVGRTLKAELAVDNYNGKDSNKIRRYICAVVDCASKFPKLVHSKDLLRKKS